jgi:hypothetical protein
MNLIDILKAKNIEDAVIQSIQEEMKANKIFTASEENLDVRYGKLKEQHTNTSAQLKEANDLIATLKQSTEGQEDLQKKVTDYETQIAMLQAQLEETQIDADVNVELLAAGVKPDDIDYVMFKLKAKGKLERGDDGKIKDMDDKIAALKTQFPAQFSGESKKNILENKLPNEHENGDAITKENLLKKPYAERMKIFNENPEAYKNAMNN